MKLAAEIRLVLALVKQLQIILRSSFTHAVCSFFGDRWC